MKLIDLIGNEELVDELTQRYTLLEDNKYYITNYDLAEILFLDVNLINIVTSMMYEEDENILNQLDSVEFKNNTKLNKMIISNFYISVDFVPRLVKCINDKLIEYYNIFHNFCW